MNKIIIEGYDCLAELRKIRAENSKLYREDREAFKESLARAAQECIQGLDIDPEWLKILR